MNKDVIALYQAFNSNIFSIIALGQSVLPNKGEIQSLRSKLSTLRQYDEKVLADSIGPILIEYQTQIMNNDIEFFTKDVDIEGAISRIKKTAGDSKQIETHSRNLLNVIFNTIDIIDKRDKMDVMNTVNEMLVQYLSLIHI